MIKTKPEAYAVMGYPISHSQSPFIHQEFAKQTNQNISYSKLKVKPEELESKIQNFFQKGGKGLNITLPHKKNVVQIVDKMTTRASLAGAVNTIFLKNNLLYGDNTDGIGLIKDLQINLGFSIKNKTFLILGAGGAAQGIICDLLGAQAASIIITNRTHSKAKEIANAFSKFGKITACKIKNLKLLSEFNAVINTTSAGILNDSSWIYPKDIVRPNALFYDLSYGDKYTPFIKWSLNLGAKNTKMGIGMLVEQAAESFAIWTKVQPNTKPILAKLNKKFNKNSNP